MARILLLEDERPLRRLMAEVLTEQGHEVVDHPDGRVIRDISLIKDFDVLITDLIMPEVDGLEAVLAIKKVNPDIKVIAFSGGGRTVTLDYLPYAKSFGAEVVLHKPFLIDELTDEVNKLLGLTDKNSDSA